MTFADAADAGVAAGEDAASKPQSPTATTHFGDGVAA